MNPYDGYRLYQIQRTKTRAEIIAEDARRGRQAAAVLRARRTLAARTRALVREVLNAISAIPLGVSQRVTPPPPTAMADGARNEALTGLNDLRSRER
jgi:hypothetical protein